MPILQPNNTLLLITPLSGGSELVLTPYSARGLTQTLEPVAGPGAGGSALGTWLRESTNGELLDLSYPWFRKLQSVISCSDTNTPCLDEAWMGQLCLVDCACERNYPTGGSPARPEVSGSSRVEGAITFYRPQLTMRITGIKSTFAEYKADYSWQIDLREAFPPS